MQLIPLSPNLSFQLWLDLNADFKPYIPDKALYDPLSLQLSPLTPAAGKKKKENTYTKSTAPYKTKLYLKGSLSLIQ